MHDTEVVISEKKLNKVKILLKKYSSQDDSESSRKNKIDETCGKSSFSSDVTQQSELADSTNGELIQIPNDDDDQECVYSDDSSNYDSDDEDSGRDKGKVVDTYGAQWDVFHREDVLKLVEFFRKYSNELNCSSKKV